MLLIADVFSAELRKACISRLPDRLTRTMACRQGSAAAGSAAGLPGMRAPGSDQSLPAWGEPQAGHQELQRAHPSHEDVFSVVGGMELNRTASARDVPTELSACRPLAPLQLHVPSVLVFGML